jgi:hypothetical protein
MGGRQADTAWPATSRPSGMGDDAPVTLRAARLWHLILLVIALATMVGYDQKRLFYFYVVKIFNAT